MSRVFDSVTALQYFRLAGGFDIVEEDIPLRDFLECCRVLCQLEGANPITDETECHQRALVHGKPVCADACAGGVWALVVREALKAPGVTVRNILFFGTGFSEIVGEIRQRKDYRPIQVRMFLGDLQMLPSSATCHKQFKCPWASAIRCLNEDWDANQGIFQLMVTQFVTSVREYDRYFMGRE